MPATNGIRSVARSLVERARIDGVVEVRVFQHRAVAGEMLERRGHAGGVHAAHVGAGELGDDRRIVGERAVADGAVAAAEVDHRREAQVDAAGAHFARHQPGVFLGELRARRRGRCAYSVPKPSSGGSAL